uniref:Sulfotransferase domain-containing protein n=1 Tax=Haptolina ericina TaxID=156174 RepID=A0A7S3ETP9_9EUKA|mmetsp:Transcript_22384/g.50560  ORF Transcript_22384/g.50560 Transcript_22384/m.50560 type:complete len:309 (+) Transcript_22384:80-1006(+)
MSQTGTVHKPLPGLPFINVGLPKSGTTSLQSFFACNGMRTAHHYVRDRETIKRALQGGYAVGGGNGSEVVYIGRAIHECSRRGQPLLSCVPGYDAYTQIDLMGDHGATTDGHRCWQPQISHLEAIVMDYPRGTFLLLTRDFESWYHSLVTYRRMDIRLAECPIAELDFPILKLKPPSSMAAALLDDPWKSRMRRFHSDVHARARAILGRSGVRWEEIDLLSPGVEQQLASLLSEARISNTLSLSGRVFQERTWDQIAKCWGHKNTGAPYSYMSKSLFEQHEQGEAPGSEVSDIDADDDADDDAEQGED